MALIPLAVLSLLALAWWMGWGVLRLLLVMFLMWLVVLVLMLAAPASEIRAAIGIDPRLWLAGGIILAVVLGYGALIRRAKAEARRRWGSEDAFRLAETPQAETAPGSGEIRDVPPAEAWRINEEAALERYARHIVLREIGGPGQAKLRRASVLIVGAGGLGAPASLYLAAAGVGRIDIADPDTVSISNLQRQIIYRTADAGRPKGLAAAEALRALNPLVDIRAMRRRIGAGDEAMLAEYDLVLDGTDSFDSRAALGAACAAAGVPLLSGAISQWEGQVTLYDPAAGGPCFACIFPEAPAPGLALPCAEAGVVGPLPGIIGSVMALEAIKQIAGAGTGLRGQMMIFDGLYGENRRIALSRRSDCPVCSGLEPRAPEA